MLWVSFSCLIALVRASKTTLERSGDSRHPCLVLHFRRVSGSLWVVDPLNFITPLLLKSRFIRWRILGKQLFYFSNINFKYAKNTILVSSGLNCCCWEVRPICLNAIPLEAIFCLSGCFHNISLFLCPLTLLIYSNVRSCGFPLTPCLGITEFSGCKLCCLSTAIESFQLWSLQILPLPHTLPFLSRVLITHTRSLYSALHVFSLLL